MPSKFLPVLLAVVVTYLVTVFCSSAPVPLTYGGTVDSGGDHLTIVTGKLHNLEADALYVMDERTKVLAIYLIRSNQLELHSVRECSHDFQLKTYGTQTPTVAEVKKANRTRARKTGSAEPSAKPK